MPLRLLLRLVAALFAAALLPPGALHGQQYPYKPIRILTSDPGGAGDFASRLIIPGMTSMGKVIKAAGIRAE